MNCEKDFENILYEIQDGILYLTLNRPEARNALTPAMWRDIRSAVEMARTDDSIKAVIVSGSGDKALAGGADIREIHDRDYLQMSARHLLSALKGWRISINQLSALSTVTPLAAVVNWRWHAISVSLPGAPGSDSRKPA